MVGNGLLSVPEARIKHLKIYARPISVSQFHSFFGLVNFNSRVVPNFAEYSALLTKHTAKTSSKTLEWTT